MRQFPPRPALSVATQKRLAGETEKIVAAVDPKAEAERRFVNARGRKWFRPVVDTLGTMAGTGQRCMFCSGSESSQVEHFRPKSVFPKLTMTWENYLWACGICNQFKSDRFPPDTEPGQQLINPVDENVWDFFFIDQFGNLTPRWRTDLNDTDPRAETTHRILRLDRQSLGDRPEQEYRSWYRRN